MTQLTAGQHALLLAKLTQRQHELDAQLRDQLGPDSRAEHTRQLLQQDIDDAAKHLAEREVDMARTDHLIHELGAVSAALLRINSSSYGQCPDCSQMIAFDRLRLEPWALRCVTCEAQQEHAARPVAASY